MTDIAGATRLHYESPPDVARSSSYLLTAWNILAKALRLLPPETAQQTVVTFLAASREVSDFLYRGSERPHSLILHSYPDDERLRVRAFGLSFPNPIGLAAGFDKDVKVRDEILDAGFGFVECGTVTPKFQMGNGGERIFRLLEDRAVINRMGFNSAGVDRIAARLTRRRPRGILGINIGANRDSNDKVSDYVTGFRRVAEFVEYVTINVSSPNTPGLRGLQNRDELEHLLGALAEARAQMSQKTPLLLKIAPDLDLAALDDIAAVSIGAGIEGLIISNTTLARPPDLKSRFKNETGGLSGAPLFAPSTAVLKAMRQRVGQKLVLVGVGGVGSGADAYAKIRAGASLVQLYTAFAYDGPALIPRIKRELLTLLARDGFAHVADAIGVDAA